MFTYALVESLNGNRLTEVTKAVAGARWTTRANSAGEATVTLQLRGKSVLDRDDWRSFTQHWSRTLVISWNDVAVYAGLVKDRVWDSGTGQLTLTLVELNAMTEWRMITGVSNYAPNGTLTAASKSKRGLLRALYQAGLNRGDASFFWNFPLDLGVDYAGGESRTWRHYSLQTVAALVDEIQDSTDGPDVHLEPEWRAGKLWWALKTGTPRLAGATFEFSQTATKPQVSAPVLTESGGKMTTGTFAIGNGSGEAMRVGLGDPADSTKGLAVFTPYRDRTISHKHVEVQSELDSIGLADVESRFYANGMKQFDVHYSDDAHPGNMRLGSRLRLWTDGDEFEPEGWFEGYLMGLSGSSRDRMLGVEVVPL